MVARKSWALGRDRRRADRTGSRPGVTAGLVAVAAALLVAVYLPLLSASGIYYDDYPYLYLRIQQYAQEFAAGYWPQALPDAVRGGGSAFPRFYPPLAYYLGAAVYAGVGDFVLAGNLTALFSILCSGASMAWAVVLLGGRPFIGVIAGIAYATMPYRFTNVLIRGALAESWALVWLPLVLAFAVRLSRGRASGPPLAVSVALLLLTHTGLALWAVPPLLVVALAGPLASLPQRAARVASYSLLGVGLAGWYLFPMWRYLPDVRASDPSVMWATAAEFARWQIRWVDVIGFGRVTWSPLTNSPLPVPMAVSLGIPVLMAPAALLLAGRAGAPDPGDRAGHRLPLMAGLAAVLVMVVMVHPAIVAGWIPQPWLYLQFPYRLAGLAGMLATTATALALSRGQPAGVGPVLLGSWGLLVGATAVLGPAVPNQVASEARLSAVLHRLEGDLTVRDEYLPRTSGAAPLGPRVEAARDRLRERADSFIDTTNHLAAVVTASDTTVLTLPRVSYDFLAIRVDGAPFPSFSNVGLVAVRLPPGRHTITVARRLPGPVWLGVAITFFSVAALGLSVRVHRRPRAAGSGSFRGTAPSS